MVFIIAEVGTNHMGSIKNAKKPTMANESLISPSVYRFDICIVLYFIF